MTLASLFSPIASFLQGAFLAMSRLDGKPGLTLDDLWVVIGWIQAAEDTFAGGPNATKITVVKSHLSETFGHKIPGYMLDVLVWLAFQFARRKGLI